MDLDITSEIRAKCLPGDDEESTVRRACDGDGHALARLYEENFDAIYRYISFQVGDRSDVEDLTSEVFFKMLRGILVYRQERGIPFSAWLYRIARNRLVDYHRRRQKASAARNELVQAAASPEAEAEEGITLASLREAMGRLPESQQRVFALRFGAGLSLADSAAVMGKSTGAVKALQYSALASLRCQLVPPEGTDTKHR